MKSIIVLASVFTFSLHFLLYPSCTSKQDEIIVHGENGQIYKKYYLNKDSLLSGPYYTYYEDGISIFEKANYIDGQLNGKRILYYRSGQPEIIETYKNELLVDTLYVYYESGVIKRKVPYDNGVLNGVLLAYYENGQLKEEVNFAENMEQGQFIEYHENGQLKWTGQYLNGDNEFGLLTEYNEQGVAIKKMNCDSLAICRTIWTLDQVDS